MSKLYVILPVVSLLFILSSCSAVKKCAEPELDLPEIMVTDFSNDSLCMADIEWSEFYSDSLLKSLIVKTLENNKDMLTASSKVEELQKRYRIAKTNLLPSISAEGLVDNETNDYEGESFTSSPEFSAKATLSWEIDLFGRLRWANKAAKFDYLSSLEAKRAMQMVLISEVATAYFELIALDNELTIVRNTVSTRTENVRQAKLRFEGGLTSETSYQQSKVELASAASMIPKLEKEVNDAVIAYTSAKETVHLMQILKESAQKYIELAYFQYINGYINYIDVLDAQRKYFDAQIDLSNAKKDEHLALIQLYKALGGGWSVE